MPENKTPKVATPSEPLSSSKMISLTNVPGLIKWLVSRQTLYEAPDNSDDEDDFHDPLREQRERLVGVYEEKVQGSSLSLDTLTLHDSESVGFNGRCNKPADTCYCFWVGASLDVSLTYKDGGIH